MPHVPQLKELYLSRNHIGVGLINLAENLIHVPRLEQLFLSDTELTERGAAHLAKALPHVPELVVLFLQNNPIGDGLIHLADNLFHLPKLRCLDITNIGGDAELKAAVKEALECVWFQRFGEPSFCARVSSN